MTESEARYLDRIRDDCRQLLGPKVEIDGLVVETGDPVVLRLTYRINGALGVSEGHGKSLTAAHADLLGKIGSDWLGTVIRAPRTRSSRRTVRLAFGALALATGVAALLLGPAIILIIKNMGI
jgi:hypothetical protein